MRFSLEDISLEPYLSDTYDAIVVKDIIARNNIKDTGLLNMILAFLMDNIANTFSARSIVAYKGTDILYIQVCYLLAAPETVERVWKS